MKESFTTSKIIGALLLLSALALPLLLPVSIICWISIGIIRLVNKAERISMITRFKKNRILQGAHHKFFSVFPQQIEFIENKICKKNLLPSQRGA